MRKKINKTQVILPKAALKQRASVEETQAIRADAECSETLLTALVTLVVILSDVAKKWIEHYSSYSRKSEFYVCATIPDYMKAEEGLTIEEIIDEIALVHGLTQKQADDLYDLYAHEFSPASYLRDPENSLAACVYKIACPDGFTTNEDGYLVINT